MAQRSESWSDAVFDSCYECRDCFAIVFQLDAEPWRAGDVNSQRNHTGKPQHNSTKGYVV